MRISSIFAISLLCPLLALAAPDERVSSVAATREAGDAANSLITVKGKDPTFAEILKGGGIQVGARFSKGPVLGSRVHVNRELLERQTGKAGPIPEDISLHTQGSGAIKRRDFSKWTRWYQEDGNVQVFRLFEGEQSVRDGVGEKGKPGRVEVFTGRRVAPGTWREWEGTYTIIKPVAANIFQLFHDGGQLWPFHIRMTDAGDIFFARRRAVPGMPSQVVLAKDMVGKSLRIRVRANGTDYEVFCKNPTDGKPWGEPIAKGSYQPARNNQISFRWGMYCGSKIGDHIRKDAMLLVNGVTIR